MKAVIKFLLNTGTGKLILQSLLSVIVRAFKAKMEKLPPEKLHDWKWVLEVVHEELHSDLQNKKISDLV